MYKQDSHERRETEEDNADASTTSDSDEDEDSSEDDSDGVEAPMRIMLVVMFCMFQGYASMVGPLQAEFKSELGAIDDASKAHSFTQAAVGVHYGKLIARLGHNIVLACMSPWTRVLIAMALMFTGVIIPPLLVFRFGVRWVGTVFISYLSAGIGLGVFEVTFLSVITPLGPVTKAWAIMGAPAGFAVVNILGLVLVSVGLPPELLYWYIVASVPVGMLVFFMYAPKGSTELKQANFLASLADCSRWGPKMVPFFLAQAVSHFVMENWPAIFYMYSAHEVSVFGPKDTKHLLKWGQFFAVNYLFIFLGDAPSRRVAFQLELDQARKVYVLLAAAVCCCATGFYMESFAIAALVPFAVFLAFWGNGSIYGLTAKYIDKFVPKEHNLAAYSCWTFIGDVGAIIGGTLVDVVKGLFCTEAHRGPYECTH